jgi:hypothetical protein
MIAPASPGFFFDAAHRFLEDFHKRTRGNGGTISSV